MEMMINYMFNQKKKPLRVAIATLFVFEKNVIDFKITLRAFKSVLSKT